jgi:hypothetical protein
MQPHVHVKTGLNYKKKTTVSMVAAVGNYKSPFISKK